MMDDVPGLGIVHLSIGGPTYSIDGVRFEYHPRFGPLCVGSRGQILDRQPGPRNKFWKSIDLWIQQGKRVTSAGACIYEIPPEPRFVCIAGRHYVEVPEGREPEDVRQEWLKKLGLA